MNLWDLIMIKARAAFNTHKADPNAHHIAYTDTQAAALIADHTAIPSAHHTRYTDVEAAAAAGTSFVSNTGDTIDGDIILNGEATINQTADNKAITLNGYDDRVNSKLSISINSDGHAMYYKSGGGSHYFYGEVLIGQSLNMMYTIFINPYYEADASLSGTPKLIVFKIDGVFYYVKGYPTKT